MVTQIIPLVALLLALTSSEQARSGEDLELVKAEDEGVSFVYTSPPLQLSPLKGEGAVHQQITLGGCGYLEEVGRPQVPVKFLHLGIPLNSEVTLRVLGTEDSVLTGLRLSPVPRVVGRDSISSYAWEEDPEFYAQDLAYPQPVGQVVEIGMLRNQRVVRVRLSPCQYNPAKGHLTWHKTIRVKVDFHRSGRRGVPPLRKDPFEGVYRATLLNYEQGRSFRSQAPSQSPVLLQHSPWYKLLTREEGLYKLTYSDLEALGIDPEAIDPRTLRLYNGGSRVLPYELSAPRPDSIPYQVALYVRGEEDGVFDREDYLLFYGLSLHGWWKNIVPDCAIGQVSLYYNPYADTNCYWLTWGGGRGERMRMRDGSLSHPTPYRPETFADTVHLEEERECPAHSGFGWVWDVGLIRDKSQERLSRDYWAQVQGVAPEETSHTIFAVYGADYKNPPFNHAVRIWVNGQLYSDTLWSGCPPDRVVPVYGEGVGLESGFNRLTLEMYRAPGDTSLDQIYLDYFEVLYRRRYEADSNRLRFSTWGNPPDTTYEFRIDNLGEPSTVLDISEPFRPVRIVNYAVSQSEIRFQDRVDTSRTYFAARAFLSPLRVSLSSWQSLRGSTGADWIAVCPDAFLDGVTALAEWRKEHLLGIPNPITRVVSLSQVYDNFSFGVPDPTAIRDFLKYAYERWTPVPGWSFLVGAGTFDYKNLYGLSNRKNFLPPYEMGDDVVGDFSLLHGNWSYDDWFVYLTPDNFPDMAIGRTTVESPQETRWIADKVVEYEKRDLGVWRNRVLLIADDEFGGGTPNEIVHTQDTEALSGLIPREVDVVKVYLMEYERVGAEKPGARDDIIGYTDEGVLAGSFLGHGSYRRLTHETVVLNPRDINALRNQGRQPFFYYGSCEVGEFEREADRGLADFMQKQRDRGGVATLGATRTTTSSANHTLGTHLFARLFGDSAMTIGDAVVGAKVAAGGGSDKLYVLFGDPATRFSLPELEVTLTVSSDTLRGGMQFRVDGTLPLPLNGYAYVSAFDSELDTFHTTPRGSTVAYTLPGSPIFKGMTRMTNGQFSQDFVVPLDLERRGMGRVSCYAWDAARSGHGAVDSLVCGVDTVALDTVGPELSLLVNGRPVEEWSGIPTSANLVGICSDENGINLTPQPGIFMSLVIDGNVSDAAPLYEYFTYDLGSYTRGSFSYPLPPLKPDTVHTLLVRVSDNLKNLTIDSAAVKILSEEALVLENVMNYPNPFSKRTWFTFQLNQPARVVVKIYTIRGRLVKSIEEPSCRRGFNKIPRDGWDGLDEEGDAVANGVYLYKVIAEAEKSIPELDLPRELRAEQLEKLVVVR